MFPSTLKKIAANFYLVLDKLNQRLLLHLGTYKWPNSTHMDTPNSLVLGNKRLQEESYRNWLADLSVELDDECICLNRCYYTKMVSVMPLANYLAMVLNYLQQKISTRKLSTATFSLGRQISRTQNEPILITIVPRFSLYKDKLNVCT